MSTLQLAFRITPLYCLRPPVTAHLVTANDREMSRRKDQVEFLEYVDLAKAAHTHPDAERAWRKYHELLEAGKKPEIRYSRRNGYSVRDKNEFIPRPRD